ncbi:hypothetical protein SCP_1901060, partial [Sparassis crispa]
SRPLIQILRSAQEDVAEKDAGYFARKRARDQSPAHEDLKSASTRDKGKARAPERSGATQGLASYLASKDVKSLTQEKLDNPPSKTPGHRPPFSSERNAEKGPKIHLRAKKRARTVSANALKEWSRKSAWQQSCGLPRQVGPAIPMKSSGNISSPVLQRLTPSATCQSALPNKKSTVTSHITVIDDDEDGDSGGDDIVEIQQSASATTQVTLVGGVIVREYDAGKGESSVAIGDTVTVRYIETLRGSTIPLSKNTDGDPYIFTVGEGAVPPGVEDGIIGMKVNGQRLIIVPPALGYGTKGTEGVPPNSTVEYQFYLLAID